MNRRRSSDSLDNGDDDVICSSTGSSSPTNFTSDDEVSADMFLMTGQSSIAKPRSRTSASPSNLASGDKYHTPAHRLNIHPLQSRNNMYQTTSSPLLASNDRLLDQSSYTGTSSNRLMERDYYNSPTDCASNSLTSRIQDVSSNSSSTGSGIQFFSVADRSWANIHNYNNQMKNVNTHRPLRRDRLRSEQSNSHNINDGENTENVGNFSDDNDEHDELFGNTNPQPLPTVSGLNRGIGTLAVMLSFKLVECRNLSEAIEFVDMNRSLIDNLTSIVTRDAPAFRNYEMSKYQTDYSIKDSFNPNFWLDREPIITTADGNCQYHAVSLSLTGSEAYTPEVRLATAVAVVDNREWFDNMLKLIDRGTVLDLVHTIARNYSWGDETTLKAIAVAIKRRIFLYTCNIGKKDYEMVKSLSEDELLNAFAEKKYRGGTGIHTYADPLVHVAANNYIMLFHKSEHFIAVLPTVQQPTMFEPYNPIVPIFT